METIDEMLRVSKSALGAMELLGDTVADVNQDMLIDAAQIIKSNGCVKTIGVKNTAQIGKNYIRKLFCTGKYVWHTIDYMAEGGRAVDINLANPLTTRPMTGSSSATAINVLYGINDVGIGTDGGGSVLSPALSLNLYSIMAKGMGLVGNGGRVSTDGIAFIPGIGVISHSFEHAKDAVYDMLGITDGSANICGMKAAVCCRGNIALPDGSDMNEKLTSVINRLVQNGVDVHETTLPDFRDRKESIVRVKELFEIYDVIITLEGPVDLMGIGDSVFGMMGKLAGSMQYKSGKYMVKIANMLDATSVTIPIDEVASGVVITSRKGKDEGIAAIKLAESITGLYKLPELYYSYFKNGNLRRKNKLSFSLEGE